MVIWEMVAGIIDMASDTSRDDLFILGICDR